MLYRQLTTSRVVIQVNSVRMRRHLQSKDFKGSVFVEFADKDTAEKVCTASWSHHLCLQVFLCAGPPYVKQLAMARSNTAYAAPFYVLLYGVTIAAICFYSR